jgi:hypothetical protein
MEDVDYIKLRGHPLIPIDSITFRIIRPLFIPDKKPAEAMLYCGLGHSQLAKRLAQYGVFKTDSGYYKREELDRMMAGMHPRNPPT